MYHFWLPDATHLLLAYCSLCELCTGDTGVFRSISGYDAGCHPQNQEPADAPQNRAEPVRCDEETVR